MIALVAATCLLSGCEQRRSPDAERPPVAPVSPGPTSELPPVDSTLNRQDLLAAIARAASNAALGASDAEEQRKLDGKRFEFRMRFGCQSASEDQAEPSRTWRFDERRRILSLTILPEISLGSRLIGMLQNGKYEAVEGFWIHRPWLLEAGCPAMPSAPPEASPSPTPSPHSSPAPLAKPAAASSPSLAIAQFFTSADTRTQRRDNRPYRATSVLAEGELPSKDGYDLVISGRLQRLADGRVIACRITSAAIPPSCIVSAQFDTVAIAAPGSRQPIARWSGS